MPTLGGVAGLTVHATGAGLGLSALLVASSQVFTALRVVGTACLGWLAIRVLRAARSTARVRSGSKASPEPPPC